MTQTTLFKRAMCRGLNAELIRAGEVAYPTKEAADYAADYVADHSGMPDPFTSPEQVTLKVAHDLSVMLKQASEIVCKNAGGYSPELSKTASAIDPVELAIHDCNTLMQKVAYEVEAPNTAEQAAAHNEAAALDAKHRPEGYANSGVGNYEDKGEGALGAEREQPRGEGAPGHNSAIENSKAASSGPYTSAPNTAANAAAHNEAAALDQKNRPGNYANVGVNKSKFSVPQGAVLGHEEPARAPVPGKNTANSAKTASEVLFEKTAAQVMPFMLQGMTDKEKVAHIQAMGPLSSRGRATYLHQLYGAYGVDKTAAQQYAEAFLKQAEGEDEDMAVASAMEQAARALQSDEEREEAAEGDEEEEGAKEAAFTGLQAAIQRIHAPR